MSEDILWPKACPGFKDLDSTLRCGICYEYMKTAMMTSCSHNYCSLCIRKSLIYKTQCPCCFEETFEGQLRNNKLLDEIICIYVNLRDTLIRSLRHEGTVIRVNQNLSTILLDANVQKTLTLESDSNDHVPKDREGHLKRSSQTPPSQLASTSTSSRSTQLATNRNNTQSLMNVDEQQEMLRDVRTETPTKCEVIIPAMFTPKKTLKSIVGTAARSSVPCPICSVEIPEKNINVHLDACLRRADSKVESSQKGESRKPLPKLVFPLLSEKDIKKKLKDHGLNIQGGRKACINRYQKFNLLYNSECDSANPRPVGELVQQVEREEREEKLASSAAVTSARLNVDRRADPKVIDEAHQQYREGQKRSFNKLIQAMKQRENQLKKVSQNSALSEEEDADDPPVGTHSGSRPILPPVGMLRRLHSEEGNADQGESSHNVPLAVEVDTDSVPTLAQRRVTQRLHSEKGNANQGESSHNVPLAVEVDTDSVPTPARRRVTRRLLTDSDEEQDMCTTAARQTRSSACIEIMDDSSLDVVYDSGNELVAAESSNSEGSMENEAWESSTPDMFDLTAPGGLKSKPRCGLLPAKLKDVLSETESLADSDNSMSLLKDESYGESRRLADQEANTLLLDPKIEDNLIISDTDFEEEPAECGNSTRSENRKLTSQQTNSKLKDPNIKAPTEGCLILTDDLDEELTECRSTRSKRKRYDVPSPVIELTKKKLLDQQAQLEDPHFELNTEDHLIQTGEPMECRRSTRSKRKRYERTSVIKLTKSKDRIIQPKQNS